MASKPSKPSKKTEATPAPALSDVRAKIDGIDRQIQSLIAERARFAHQVGKAKGKLAAAVDYYRPEREAQVLRMVVDRNDEVWLGAGVCAIGGGGRVLHIDRCISAAGAGSSSRSGRPRWT